MVGRKSSRDTIAILDNEKAGQKKDRVADANKEPGGGDLNDEIRGEDSANSVKMTVKEKSRKKHALMGDQKCQPSKSTEKSDLSRVSKVRNDGRDALSGGTPHGGDGE